MKSHFDAILGWICPLPPEAWETNTPDPETAGASWRRQVQAAMIIRYTVIVLAVYFLRDLLQRDPRRPTGAPARQAPPSSPESRIRVGAWVGVAIFAACSVGLIVFLRSSAWEYRQERRGVRIGGRGKDHHERRHRLLTVGLGLGLALGGLHSAVFQLFIVLAVFAILTIVITRFSETWNWPLQAFPLRVLIPILVVLIVGWTNSSPSKLRIPSLEGLYGKPVRIQPVLNGAVDAVPEDDIAVLEAWKAAAQKSMPADGQGNKPNPKLAILAVSGGANRAGFWNAAVLEKLDSLPHFRSHLRLITGASGGMVGAAYYVAELNNPGATAGRRLIDRIPTDSLSPVVRQWMLGDIPLIFWPRDLRNAWDRGVTLERSWPELRIPFKDLEERELKGEIPSMIFSPMIVEDGRQLLISNLNLPFMTHARGNLLSPGKELTQAKDKLLGPGEELTQAKGKPPGAEGDLYSYPSVEFFKLYPDKRDRFELGTAVRLNASFPYVSPAACLTECPLPTGGRRRLLRQFRDHGRRRLDLPPSSVDQGQHVRARADPGPRFYPKQVDRLELITPEPSTLDAISSAFQFSSPLPSKAGRIREMPRPSSGMIRSSTASTSGSRIRKNPTSSRPSSSRTP